jgi:exonuclease SbcC
LFFLWPARDLAATLARQDRLSRGIRVKEASLALHQRLAPPPDIADTPDLARTLARLTGLRHNLDRKELEAGVLENLEPPSKPYPAGELYRDLGRLAASRLGVQSRSARCEVLSRLREPPAVTDTSALEALLAGFSGLGRRLAEAKQDEARVGRRMEELGADITRRLEDIGRCPLCGGELDPERFLAQGEGCGHG